MTKSNKRVVPRMKTNGNEWQLVITNGNEWYNNENEWKRMRSSKKESDFGFRMKQNMECINAIYSER